jgi:hypothetical protein
VICCRVEVFLGCGTRTLDTTEKHYAKLTAGGKIRALKYLEAGLPEQAT